MKTSGPGALDLAGVLGRESSDKRIEILRRIGEGGSISEAARRAGVSYKAAWQAIETLGNLAGTPMVEKTVGGSGGGGALLTPAGRHVLDAAVLLGQARAQVLHTLQAATLRAAGERVETAGIGHARAGPGLAALALRTSMRNLFPCEVRSLSRTGGLVRVGLALPEGPLLYARITRESAQLLELARGLHLLALCKAAAVRVAADIAPSEGHNVLAGVVQRASRAASGGEVSLRLAGGSSLVGFAAAGHRLSAGQPAAAGIEESGVVLAVPG
jgi:molybdate transport system regulatory protein